MLDQVSQYQRRRAGGRTNEGRKVRPRTRKFLSVSEFVIVAWVSSCGIFFRVKKFELVEKMMNVVVMVEM